MPRRIDPFFKIGKTQFRSQMGSSDLWAMLVVLLGVAMRLRQYFINRAFWLDESLLANNLPAHSLIDLLTRPLDSDQAAPAGFLLSLKLLGKLSAYQDQALRLSPLFFSLCLLLAAYQLRRRFHHPAPGYLFMGLLAASPVLIYYSTELKQYGVDVFFTILILWIALNFQCRRWGAFLLIIVGALAILFSNPSVLVLAAVGITLLVQAVIQRDKRQIIQFIGVGFAWLVVFAFNYYFATQNITQNATLNAMWVSAFAPLPTSAAGAQWYLDTLLGFAYLGFSLPAPVPVSVLPSWYTLQNFLVLAGMLAGAYFLYRRNRKWFFINLLVMLLTVLASFLKIYPARSRPILFLLPILFSYLAALVEGLLSTSSRWTQYVAIGLSVLCLSFACVPAVDLLLHPSQPENIKPLLTFLQQNQRPGDKIALSAWSVSAFNYYQDDYQLNGLARVNPIAVQNDSSAFLQSLCTTQQFGRIWIFFSHRFNERIPFLDNLSAQVPLLTHWEGVDNGAYLFDFDPSVICK